MYGMTETAPVTLQCFPEDAAWVRSNTIGAPSDHVEVGALGEFRGVVSLRVFWEVILFSFLCE